MICGWGALAIVLLFALILALSPVATHIVNTKGEEIVGRQLHADRTADGCERPQDSVELNEK